MSHSHPGSRHGVSVPSLNLPDALFFSRDFHDDSTNGLQSRTRKWLFAFTTSMFALSTLYWILSVVFTFLLVDSLNNSIRACYGRDNAFLCILREIAALHIQAANWLSMFDDILLVNVSAVQYKVPASYRRVICKRPS